jgi:hypothetical protein
MLDWLRYRYQLFRLQFAKMRTQHFFARAWRQAKKNRKSQQERDDLALDEMHLIEIDDENIVQLMSEYLQTQARKLYLPVPEFSTTGDRWERSHVTGRYRLTPSAILALRSAIRAEKKERSEHIRAWIAIIAPIITALTGLTGGLIGLLALIWRHQAGAP